VLNISTWNTCTCSQTDGLREKKRRKKEKSFWLKPDFYFYFSNSNRCGSATGVPGGANTWGRRNIINIPTRGEEEARHRGRASAPSVCLIRANRPSPPILANTAHRNRLEPRQVFIQNKSLYFKVHKLILLRCRSLLAGSHWWWQFPVSAISKHRRRS
jgi:hypothetical protein